MEHNSTQICNAVFQAALLVLLPIEFGILQTSLHYALIASTNVTSLIRQIGNCDEIWCQNPTTNLPHRKTLLLVF